MSVSKKICAFLGAARSTGWVRLPGIDPGGVPLAGRVLLGRFLACCLIAQRGIFLTHAGAARSWEPLAKLFLGGGRVAAPPLRARARVMPAGMLATPACADVASGLERGSKTGGFPLDLQGLLSGYPHPSRVRSTPRAFGLPPRVSGLPPRSSSLPLRSLRVKACGLVPLTCGHKLYIASRLNKRGRLCCFVPYGLPVAGALVEEVRAAPGLLVGLCCLSSAGSTYSQYE